MTVNVIRRSLVIALAAAGCHAWAQHSQMPASISLGVVPQFPALEIQRRWEPLINWINETCQVRIQIRHAKSIPEFEKLFMQGDLDLAYMNPYHAVMAYRAQGYEPLVRDDSARLKGVLVVKANGNIKSLADLNGKTLAFPAPNAFGASLYMRALLTREHGVSFEPYYAKTHANAYRHVLTGQAAAAGGVAATLAAEPEEVRNQLKVLYETPPAAPHPLAAHPRVNDTIKQCITEGLTQPNRNQPILEFLRDAQMPQPVVASFSRDYLPLEKLSLEQFVVQRLP